MINAENSDKNLSISPLIGLNAEEIRLYKLIGAFKNPYWLTFSPDAALEPVHADQFMDKWELKFIKFVLATRDGVYVMESQRDSGRFHWHIMLDVTDVRRLHIFIKGIAFEPQRQMQYKIYKGLPAGGIQYLFKDTEDTSLHLKRHTSPIIYDSCLRIKYDKQNEANKFLRKKKSELDHGCGLNSDIPKAFRRGAHDSDTEDD